MRRGKRERERERTDRRDETTRNETRRGVFIGAVVKVARGRRAFIVGSIYTGCLVIGDTSGEDE